MTDLTPAQRAALDHVTAYARTRKAEGVKTIDDVLRMCDIARVDYDEAVATLKAQACVALHFHPDRPGFDGRSVAESLQASGVYKSQFETLMSNGSVSAHPGGDRDLWEQRLFGGSYHCDGATNAQRPKYGALDLMRHPDGPAPRFGSCYFLLKPAVAARCTFTYLDSHRDPKEQGTFAEFDDVMAALLEDIFYNDRALGESTLTVPQLIRILAGLAQPPISGQPLARNLNHYIEAQVHGDVYLARDVDALVADPSFQGTQAGAHLEALAETFGFNLRWHPGFVLKVAAVPRDFRGPTMPSLARRIARGDVVDAACIGPAVVDLQRQPTAWVDRGTPAEVLQDLKRLWHVLVRYG